MSKDLIITEQEYNLLLENKDYNKIIVWLLINLLVKETKTKTNNGPLNDILINLRAALTLYDNSTK